MPLRRHLHAFALDAAAMMPPRMSPPRRAAYCCFTLTMPPLIRQ